MQLFLHLLLLFSVTGFAAAAEKQITIGEFDGAADFLFTIPFAGVALSPGDEQTKRAIERGLSSIQLTDTVIKMREVVIDSNSSECDVCQRLLQDEAPVTALIDATDSVLMRTFARKSGIPTISTSHGMEQKDRAWTGLSEQESEYLIQVNPPEDTIATIVQDMVHEYGIRNAVLLFDSSFGKNFPDFLLLWEWCFCRWQQVTDRSVAARLFSLMQKSLSFVPRNSR